MPIVDDHTKIHLKEFFKELKDEVTIHFFRNKDCIYCNETKEILEAISETSNEKVKIVEHNYEEELELAKEMGLFMAPAIVIHGSQKYKIVYYGIPSGYEFQGLIEGILDVSHGNIDLPPSIIEQIKGIDKEVQILVFVTPTCPYCPRAVRSAHKYALINPKIAGYMIEAMEFEKLSQEYNVMAVPKIVIRVEGEDKVEFEGAYPDQMFVEKIMEALKDNKKEKEETEEQAKKE